MNFFADLVQDLHSFKHYAECCLAALEDELGYKVSSKRDLLTSMGRDSFYEKAMELSDFLESSNGACKDYSIALSTLDMESMRIVFLADEDSSDWRYEGYSYPISLPLDLLVDPRYWAQRVREEVNLAEEKKRTAKAKAKLYREQRKREKELSLLKQLKQKYEGEF